METEFLAETAVLLDFLAIHCKYEQKSPPQLTKLHCPGGAFEGWRGRGENGIKAEKNRGNLTAYARYHCFLGKGTPTTFSLLPVDYWFCRFILVGSSEPQKACWNEVKVLWVCWAHCRKMFVRICFGLRSKAQRESEVHQIVFSSTSWSSCLLQGKTSQSTYLPSYHVYFLSNLSCKRPFRIAWSLSAASELITRDSLWFFSRKRPLAVSAEH